MSGTINFIRANPAAAGFDSMTNQLYRMEDRSNARGVDAAIRRGVLRSQKERHIARNGAGGGVGSILPAGTSMPEAPVAESAPGAILPGVEAGEEEMRSGDGGDEGMGDFIPAGPAQDEANLSPSADLQPVSLSSPAASVPARGVAPQFVAQGIHDRGRLDRSAEDFPQQIMAVNDRVVRQTFNGAQARPSAPGMELLSNTLPAGTALPGTTAPAEPGANGAGAIPPAGTSLSPASYDPPSNARRAADPILEELAQVPGGGSAALRIVDQQGRREVVEGREAARTRERAERMALQALGRGDLTTYHHFAPQARITLPESVLQDNAMRARIATAGLLAQRFYRGDAAGARRFVEQYVRTGNGMQALERAGPPSSAAATGFRPQWVLDGEQEILMFFNPRNPSAPAVPAQGPNGETVGRTPRGPQPTVRTMEGENGPVLGTVDPRRGTATPITGPGGEVARPPARPVPGQRGITPQNEASAYRGFLAIAARNPDMMDNPAAQQRFAEQQMEQTYGAGWRQRIQARPGAPAAAPAAPAAPAATPAPAAPPQAAAPAAPAAPAATPTSRPLGIPPGSMFSPSRQQWRDPQGNLYDAAGNPLRN